MSGHLSAFQALTLSFCGLQKIFFPLKLDGKNKILNIFQSNDSGFSDNKKFQWFNFKKFYKSSSDYFFLACISIL